MSEKRTHTPWLSGHETFLVALLGLLVFAALNALMLQYHYEAWTNPKVGFWTAFFNKFEISGFDSYTYIIVSKWRPLYVLARHPLLAAMMWPLSELNVWLKDVTGMNCAIHIVAVVWTLLSLASWLLMHRILRRLMGLGMGESLLLTLYFFSFSHVMLTAFTPDHMTLTLPLLLAAVYLAGRAIQRGRTLPTWQALTLAFVAAGVTTTNIVKIALADLFTQAPPSPPRGGEMTPPCAIAEGNPAPHSGVMWGLIRHFALYLIPAAIIAAAYLYQQRTTQVEESRYAENVIEKRSAKDSVFAVEIQKSLAATERRKEQQIMDIPGVTNTEYHISRRASLVENVFGEGFLLHEDFALKDANRHRPVLVRYRHWWQYAIEGTVVLLFVLGAWCGRRNRVVLMTLSMLAFDMLLHVGLNFASADVYIMTAHWAFAVPVAMACLFRRVAGLPRLSMAVTAATLFLTAFLWTHNLQIVVNHIL